MEFNSSSAPFGICSINGFGFVPIYSLEREMPFLRSVTASPKVSATCQATPGEAEEEGGGLICHEHRLSTCFLLNGL